MFRLYFEHPVIFIDSERNKVGYTLLYETTILKYIGFTCLSPLANQDKIFIFRKSSVNFSQINRSALNVDVSYYSNSNEFFICRSVC